MRKGSQCKTFNERSFNTLLRLFHILFPRLFPMGQPVRTSNFLLFCSVYWEERRRVPHVKEEGVSYNLLGIMIFCAFRRWLSDLLRVF